MRLSDTLDDAKGTHPRVVTMRFVSLARVDGLPGVRATPKTCPATVPAGQALWRLTLHFAADP